MQLHQLPPRAGDRPSTTSSAPHTQLDQNAPIALQNALSAHAMSLPGVRVGRSQVSVPGAIAFYLDAPEHSPAIPDLFGGEWGHIHPAHDGSMHLNVPTEIAHHLIAQGWAEFHYVVTRGLVPPVVIMLFGPRDDQELAIAQRVVETAYVAAGGSLIGSDGEALDPLEIGSRELAP